MPIQASKNKSPIESIYEYRKSVFKSDMFAGVVVVLLALLILILAKIENTIAYLFVASNLALCGVVSFFLYKKKYIYAVYTNLFVSILLTTFAIIIFGSIYNIRIFFISLSLSAFIYTANQKFNQFFFVLHIALFSFFSLFEVSPVSQVQSIAIKPLQVLIIILFGISFMYKGLLIFNLYIKSESSVKRNNLIYQTLFNNTYEGIVSVHINTFKQTRYEIPNPQVFSLFNDPDFSIQHISDYLPKYQPNGSLSIDYFNQIQHTLKKANRIENEFTFLTKDKTIIHTKITIAKLHDVLQTITIYLFKNVTEEVKNQKIISAQLEELNNKNTQLTEYIEGSLQFENFAHLASHDLKTPIRSLVSFSQLLERNNKNKLDTESLEYLSFIKHAAQKMNFLINDLSEYAKITVSKSINSNIRFSIFLSNIFKEIESKYSGFNINFELINLPHKLKADERKIKILFFNLISNAIKFRKTECVPKIKIKHQEDGDKHQFAIEDNGIGIEKAYLTEIFLIFKKLNAADDSDNAGIGLSTCKKIVQQHKGKIWVQSTLNKGSTFYFTISKKLFN